MLVNLTIIVSGFKVVSYIASYTYSPATIYLKVKLTVQLNFDVFFNNSFVTRYIVGNSVNLLGDNNINRTVQVLQYWHIFMCNLPACNVHIILDLYFLQLESDLDSSGICFI